MKTPAEALISMLFTNAYGIHLSSKKGRKEAGMYLIFAVCMIPMMILVYMEISNLFGAGMYETGVTIGMVMTCVVCCFFLLFSFPAELYFSSDLPALLVLPVAPRTVILAKTAIILIGQIPFVLMCAIPLCLAAMTCPAFAWWQTVLIFIETVLCAITAVLVLGILTILVMQFLPFFHNKDRFNLIVGVLALTASIGFSLYSSSMEEDALLRPIASFSGLFFQVIPAVKAVFGSGLMLVLSFVIPAAAGALYAWTADRFYLKAALSSSSSAPKTVRTRKEKEAYSRSLFDASVVIEFKKLIRTPAYVTNNLLSALIFPAIFAGMFLFLPQMKEAREWIESIDLWNSLQSAGISPGGAGLAAGIVLSLFLASLNSVSATAISREGRKGVDWMKSVPLDLAIQLNAKMISGFIVSMVTIILMLGAVLLLIPMNPAFVFSYLAVSIPVCLLVNQLCLIGDIRFPKLDWTSEAALKNNFVPAMEMFAFYALCGGSVLILLLSFESFGGSGFNLAASVLGIVFAVLVIAFWKLPVRAFKAWL